MKKFLKISKYKPSVFQGRFDFSASAGASLTVEHPVERHVVRILSVVLVALICGYLYFVSASVLNVMSRRDALAHIAQIQGSIGGLEQQYFTLSHGVSPTAGAGLGLAPVSATHYVYRPGNVGAAAATIARNAI